MERITYQDIPKGMFENLMKTEDFISQSEKEMAALNLTDVLTKLSRDPLPEIVFDALIPHFNKEEICYLTLAISQINTWTRLMKTFKFTPGNYQVKELKNV
jgi:alkylhydroperoxidase family enzyme